jgi:ATP synthase protein I
VSSENLRARDITVPQPLPDDSWEDAVDETPFKVLTREEAQGLVAKLPAWSPWSLVAAQALVGVVGAVLWWLFTQEGSKAWSALYGAIAVVVPNALMAWGATRRPVADAGVALLSMMFWESIKILLAIAILVVVAMRVSDLSWLAMLLTMILCLKVNWLVLLTRGRTNKH